MDKFEKDKNLLNGKGEKDLEWFTTENGVHVPLKQGQTKAEAIKEKFGEEEQKKDAVKRLVDTLRKVKNLKMKEIHNYIKSLSPIKLSINDDEILAEFDKYTADKNVYGHGKSDAQGYNYKISNVDKLPSIIEDSKYQYSKKELGKISPQHRNVKEWHYFTKQIDTEKGPFNIVVNVRDKGKNQYVYEVAIRKKKT